MADGCECIEMVTIARVDVEGSDEEEEEEEEKLVDADCARCQCGKYGMCGTCDPRPDAFEDGDTCECVSCDDLLCEACDRLNCEECDGVV
jgi:hypothetical protein